MPAEVYPDLEELLGRAVVEDLSSTLEFEPRGPVSSNEVPAAISKALGNWSRADLGAPPGTMPLTWVGRRKQLQVQWPNLISNFKAEERSLDPGVRRAYDVLVKHATSLHKQLQPLGEIRLVAFIVDVHFSIMKPSPLSSPGPLIASFMRVPASMSPLVDADWRIATQSDRYFTNWSLSTYETRQIEARQMVGPQGPLMTQVTSNTLTDNGLRLRVDVNTKVNQVTKSGAISVNSEDFAQLREIGMKAIQEGIALLRGVAS